MNLDAAEILDARILIVDDQQSHILLLETMLRNVGYHNISSTKQPEIVCQGHARQTFDLILLDLQMACMDGFEVLKYLKKQDPHGTLPVLVFAARREQKLRALQAGAKDFINQPFEVIEVQTRVHTLLEVRLLHKKLADYNKVLEQTVLEQTAELRASEARFKSFTELSSDWYWEQNAQGQFIRVSGPVLEMLGLGKQKSLLDVSVNSSTSAIANASNNANSNANQQLALTPGSNAVEADSWNSDECGQLHANIAARRPFLDLVYRKKMRDGSTQYLQVSGEPMFDSDSRFIGYRGIGMMLDDRRRPDQDQRLFRNAMGLVEQGVVLIERASLHMIDANETFCRMLGYLRAQLLVLDLPDIHLGDKASLATDFDLLLAGQAIAPHNVHLRGKNGLCLAAHIEWYALQQTASPIVVGVINASAESAQLTLAMPTTLSPASSPASSQFQASFANDSQDADDTEAAGQYKSARLANL